MSTRSSQRGVAVLMAMLVVTIGTIIAVNLLWRETLDLRRTQSALDADQGIMYMQGAEAWAADILRQDQVDSPSSDNLSEPWATQLPPLPVDGGTIIGKLEDLQGRFNLNNLLKADGTDNPLAVAQFERLLTLLQIDPALAGAVLDWLDVDSNLRFPTGGEDVTYAGIDPPYRAANSMITSPSELMAVSGFNREIYAKLAPYVTALPIGTKLNVNTASAIVLASLDPNLDISAGEGLVEQRADGAFVDIDKTFEKLVDPKVLREIDGVSQHFLLTATVTLGTNQLTMRAVLQRDASGVTRALFRSLGVE